MQVGVDQRDGACRRCGESVDIITAANGFGRHLGAGSPEIGREVGAGRRGRSLLTVFQSPLLLGLVNDAEVINARIGLGGLPRADEVGNTNRC